MWPSCHARSDLQLEGDAATGFGCQRAVARSILQSEVVFMRIVFVSSRIAGAACIALLAAAVAHAADIPAPVFKAPAAAPAPASKWTGFHLSGGGGYGLWAAESNTTTQSTGFNIPLPLIQTMGGRGWLGRVGGGYDYQINARIVAGVFADFDFSSLKGTIHDASVGLAADIKQTSAWAAGARLGWLITPDLLSYFTAGYSHARFSSGTFVAFAPGGATAPGVPSGFASPGFDTSGWLLGGGAEASLGGGWFWRNEYRYAYYDNTAVPDVNVSSPAAFPAFNSINFKPTVQTVTTQLVYRFNPGGPSGSTADFALPFFPSPQAPLAANWTGVYANAGIGYGLWVADETTALLPGGGRPVLVPQRQGGSGWLGRVGGGYDRQFGQRFVAGVFGDFDVSSLEGSLQDVASGLDGEIKQERSWSVGGRAGWLITPVVLGYAAGGYTSTHFSSVVFRSMATGAPFGGTSTPAFTVDGWFAGGGFEAAIRPGWFWRNEYRYSEFDTATVTMASNPAVLIGNNVSFRPTVQTVTSQLVYKLNWTR
jgi:outer membrane immunogenic protein